MIKKIKRFIGDLIEKIFKRMELHNIKLKASFLKDRIKENESIIEEQAEVISKITTGQHIHLTYPEQRMLLKAIKHPAFEDWIETPATKAHHRIIWKDLKEKMKLYLEEEPAKEDNETKAGENG